MLTIRFLQLFIILILISSCSIDPHTNVFNELKPKIKESITVIPMESEDLNTFETFKSKGENWQLVGGVYTDVNDGSIFELESGTGIIANKMTDSGNEGLYSTFEHGDIEFQFEYLIPKKSNSGIYFQGRYELQLSDDFDPENLSISNTGAIYERWDDSKPDGEKGYEGYPPLVNASIAPGLWQEMKVYFRAPKFDNNGNKIENARFESVVHNGVLIQDNVSLSGPTRGPFLEGEKAFGPIVIQGDHGNIAFRNIKYKSYTQDSLSLSDITYKYFELPDDGTFPNYDSITVLKTGSATTLDPNIANENEDNYGLIFNGKIHIPKSGKYLFKTYFDDDGEFLINNKTLIQNDGKFGPFDGNSATELDSGLVDFELRFFDKGWRATIKVDYEGPNIYRHPLGRTEPAKKARDNSNRILIESVSEPEIYRNFTVYKGKKRTHAISVGSPDNIHFSYDLQEGTLLKFWKGGFADMTGMWKNRGEPQILEPLSASVESNAGVPLGTLNANENKWKALSKNEITYKGYEISDNGVPLFSYESDQISWSDILQPSSDKKMLVRSVTVVNSPGKLTMRIAQGEVIKKLPNGLFTIDSKYYIKLNDSSKYKIITSNQNELIVFPDESGQITYSIFW